MQQTEPGKPGVDLHAILRVGGAVFAVLLALLLAAACLSSYMEWLNAPSDVIAYWQGGTHAMNGEPLYVESHDQAHYRPFLYPPAFAAFFSMFVRLGPRFGLALWAVTHLLFGFLLMAYRPLSDVEMADYNAFSRTGAGQALNAALFEGFEVMYRDISHALGLAAAQAMSFSEL